MTEYAIAVVGAGPRGTSFLERLLARVESTGLPARGLRVVVADPAPHGAGRVWDPAQSPLYLMNTPAAFPTAAPVAGTQERLAASSCSASFLQWWTQHGADRDVRDAAGTWFPSRSEYGQYLTWLHHRVVEALEGAGVTVDRVHQRILSLACEAPARAVTLQLQDRLDTVDAAVLSLGHVPADLSADPMRAALADSASGHGLHYQPPAIPTDVDLDALPAAAPILVRGMGLNFFDLMIAVTVGRGGRFRTRPGAAPGQQLEYIASGEEPRLIAGARRGTPYRSKTTAPGFLPEGTALTHFSPEAVRGLAQQHGPLDFEEHLLPLIMADVQATYSSFGGAGTFDPRAYAAPFHGRRFSDRDEHRAAVLDWLEQDAASSAAAEGSPEKLAVKTLHAARFALKAVLTEGLVDEASRTAQIEPWFEPLSEGLASGAPVQRTEEMAALVRAGLIEVLGPSPIFAVDSSAGLFAARSPQVPDVQHTASHLIEAMMPPNRVGQADEPLIRTLLRSGEARPAVLAGAEHKGFDVSPSPHRLLSTAGEVQPIHVLGLQLSSAQWGTAIAAETGGDPRTTASTLADAEAAAAHVMDLAHRT
ncbi:FAD/NAD(P)-binding domain-containing protein [Nesterenkonia sp. NBAIMH1]|uniref:FAD/NAD(P)-binding protein n=1 Tax=Nesterenkonia sp. NBAIMH1 TaxID=2600320 RepID=UPI00143E0863|nr:FAD/NAD(P)-binding protein [Nesterenkonia sp. NBAIMH1]